MHRPRLTACIVLICLCGPHAGAGAGDESRRDDQVILLKHCTIDYDRSTVVGSSLTGVLQECAVRAGDRVRAGQVLGRLNDQDIRLERELRASEAESDLGVRLSEAKYALALKKMKNSEVLTRRTFMSAEEFSLHRLEAETAALAVQEAKHLRLLAQIHLRQADAALHARELVSPHDGVVVAILKTPGEPVIPKEPVFQVVNVDRLRVTGSLDVIDVWRVKRGQSVMISPEVPGAHLAVENEVFKGRIVFVDRLIQAETQTCKVVAEVENRDDWLRAGLQAQMEIQPGSLTAASAITPTVESQPTPRGVTPTVTFSRGTSAAR